MTREDTINFYEFIKNISGNFQAQAKIKGLKYVFDFNIIDFFVKYIKSETLSGYVNKIVNYVKIAWQYILRDIFRI